MSDEKTGPEARTQEPTPSGPRDDGSARPGDASERRRERLGAGALLLVAFLASVLVSWRSGQVVEELDPTAVSD